MFVEHPQNAVSDHLLGPVRDETGSCRPWPNHVGSRPVPGPCARASGLGTLSTKTWKAATDDSSGWNETRRSSFGSRKPAAANEATVIPRHSMGLPYMPTLTPQTHPTDRHIWQSHGVSGIYKLIVQRIVGVTVRSFELTGMSRLKRWPHRRTVWYEEEPVLF